MSFISTGLTTLTAELTALPTVRGRAVFTSGMQYMRSSLPEDPIGTCYITLVNLVIGSVVQASNNLGEITTTTATSSSLSIVAQVYTDNDLNTIIIKVRKGSSSPFYIPYQTVVLASVGAQNIYVSQTLDE